MSRAIWILLALTSHWRRRPVQLLALLVGIAAATALWSGVQALNAHARASYDRAAAAIGGDRTPFLAGVDGRRFAQELFVDLRRAGWPVSPLLEGWIEIGGRSLRLVGVEPLTLPRGAAFGVLAGDGGDLARFLTPPFRSLVGPETRAALGLGEGAAPVTDRGAVLPPLATRAGMAPGLIAVDIGVAQRLLGAPGEVSRLLLGEHRAGARPALSEVVGDRLHRVEPGADSDLARLTDSFHLNLTAFGLLSFVVGLFIAHSAIGLAFEQRRATMRTLRACGVSSRLLTGVLLGELLAIALVAGAAGVACGYLVASALLPDVAASLHGLYGARMSGELALEPGWVLAGLAMSVLGALTAAAGSLWSARRLPVLATARPVAWRGAHQRALEIQGAVAAALFALALLALAFGGGLVAGFAVMAGLLLGAALTLPLLLGMALRLGERSARRPLAQWFWADSRQQLSGLSLALMALLLALAVNVGVGTMVSSFRTTFETWLDQRLAAEIYLRAENGKQAARIETWLARRQEVEAILPNWSVEARLEDWPTQIYGFADHATYRDHWPLLDAGENAWDRLRAGDAALISEQLARRQDIALGDALHIPAAAGALSVEVVGVYPDYGNPKGQIIVNVEVLARHWPDVERTDFGLRLSPAEIPGLITALRAEFGPGPLRVIDQATLKAGSTRIFERTFAVTAALNALTLGVAGIALLTSLLTLANARLPQLAPIWAIGVTRRDLAWIELLRTMALALITALIALPLGLVVAWLLVAVVNVEAFGWRLPLHFFPLQWALLLGLALITSLLACVAPIIRLRRTPPAQLLKVFADER
ncbi:MAG: FtsX-like permease family protein [Alphaproteobacteria bacterium]